MRVLTVVTWCHYMRRCKLNTSYSCGAIRLMALMRWGRTVCTFPVTTYIWWTKLYISQHCLHYFLAVKQANPLIPAGTSYLRWQAVCSHDHLWIFLSGCLIRSSQSPLWVGPATRMFLSHLWWMVWELGRGTASRATGYKRFWRRQIVFIPSLKPAGTRSGTDFFKENHLALSLFLWALDCVWL